MGAVVQPRPKDGTVRQYAYQIVMAEVVWSWFSFVVSLTIAFMQMDMFVIEVLTHCATTAVITFLYLRAKDR